jgi:S-adenosylmethionine synthetase
MIRLLDDDCIDRSQAALEVVERKGIGHPDTLAELIADELIRQYALHTLDVFEVVPNLNVDKVLLVGGLAHLDVGAGAPERKTKAHLVGKITASVGGTSIPVDELFHQAVHRIISECVSADYAEQFELEVHNNDRRTEDASHPVYRPQCDGELRPCDGVPRSGDTVAISTSWPPTPLEHLVVDIESMLTSDKFRQGQAATGTDVKVMARRVNDAVRITICLPVVADRLDSESHYHDVVQRAQAEVADLAARASFPDARIDLNTKDRNGTCYLTRYGTALDKGDQGIVGRGSAWKVVDSHGRWIGSESIGGKSPFTHPGKFYFTRALSLARRLWGRHEVPACVTLLADNGSPILEPDELIARMCGAGDGVQADGVQATADKWFVEEWPLPDQWEVTATAIALVDPVDRFRGGFGFDDVPLSAAGGSPTASAGLDSAEEPPVTVPVGSQPLTALG